MRTRIKICGITNKEDAMAAVEQGVDAIGFVFTTSPRRVDIAQAAEIACSVPLFISKVGVFSSENDRFIAKAVKACALEGVQIHGEEGRVFELPEGIKLIDVVRVSVADDVRRAASIKSDGVLLDAKIDGFLGGTGMAFDWELLDGVAFASPLILSGGLNPDNVVKAVRRVRPYAVDVSSGVEKEPGIKEHGKIAAFVRGVREADAEAHSRMMR